MIEGMAAFAAVAGAFFAFALQRLRKGICNQPLACPCAAQEKIGMGASSARGRTPKLLHQRGIPSDFLKCIQIRRSFPWIFSESIFVELLHIQYKYRCTADLYLNGCQNQPMHRTAGGGQCRILGTRLAVFLDDFQRAFYLFILHTCHNGGVACAQEATLCGKSRYLKFCFVQMRDYFARILVLNNRNDEFHKNPSLFFIKMLNCIFFIFYIF